MLSISFFTRPRIILTLLLLICRAHLTAGPQWHTNNYDYEWNALHNLDEEKVVFLNAFTSAYQAVPLETLRITNLDEWLHQGFIYGVAHWVTTDILVTAKNNGTLVGFAIFGFLADGRQAHLKVLAVDPAYHGKGIGRQLVFSVIRQQPNLSTIFLDTRHVNVKAQLFYKKIGFTESSKPHDALDPELWMGFEHHVTRHIIQ